MSRYPVALHVIEKKEEDKNLREIDSDNNFWESGNWSVTKKRAEQLIGGLIYIHKGQLVPSHKGGQIQAIEKVGEDRFKFVFLAQKCAENNVTDKSGWSNEKKFEWIDSHNEKNAEEDEISDEDSYPEGREKFRIHCSKERSSALTRSLKRRTLAETGKLECEACATDFFEKYGELGLGFIEAHHKIPVSTMNDNHKTKISELALVCSNCHRMLHRSKKLIAVSELELIISEIKSKK